jgi:hypothetical protein
MLGRNTTTPNTKIRLFFVDAAFLAMTTFAVTAIRPWLSVQL